MTLLQLIAALMLVIEVLQCIKQEVFLRLLARVKIGSMPIFALQLITGLSRMAEKIWHQAFLFIPILHIVNFERVSNDAQDTEIEIFSSLGEKIQILSILLVRFLPMEYSWNSEWSVLV